MTRKIRPGRPPRSKKSAAARFELRLTGDELKRWTALADRIGISLSELVRECVECRLASVGARMR